VQCVGQADGALAVRLAVPDVEQDGARLAVFEESRDLAWPDAEPIPLPRFHSWIHASAHPSAPIEASTAPVNRQGNGRFLMRSSFSAISRCTSGTFGSARFASAKRERATE
jgi:hypothetical protein